MDLRREQDIEYYQSLLLDQINDLKIKRDHDRLIGQEFLRNKLPHHIIDLVSKDDIKLMHVPSRFLSPEERERVTLLRAEITRLQDGGCLYYNEGEIMFKLRIPGVAITLCFNLIDLFEQGLVDTELKFADVNISLDQSEDLYRYPLNDEETKRLLDQARDYGIMGSEYPRLINPEIEETYVLLQELQV